MTQTDQHKIIQILGALNLPQGHYTVLGPAAMVLDPDLNETETDRIDIFVDTATFFMLYESTDAGIIWTLCLPDPQDENAKNDPPYLEYNLLDITIAVGFAIKDEWMPQRIIKASDNIEGITVYTNGYRSPQWISS